MKPWTLRWIVCASIALLCVALAVPSLAHELVAENAGTWRAERAAHMPGDPVPGTASAGSTLYYIIVLANRWPNGSTIKVCFYGGGDELRKKIVAAAQPWFDEGNIRMDAGTPVPRTCVDHDASNIRIGFDEPGYWSYIGTDGVATDLVSKNLSSLNLHGYDTAPPNELEFSGIVLHEFGHALGLHHEHQSPSNECADTIDWDHKVYPFFENVYGWDKAKVDQNLRPLLANRSAYDWGSFDPESVMIYASDPQFLKDGTPSQCIFHANYALSSNDRNGIKRAYPPGQDVKVGLAVQAASLDAVLKHSTLDPKLKKALTVQRDLTKAALNAPSH